MELRDGREPNLKRCWRKRRWMVLIKTVMERLRLRFYCTFVEYFSDLCLLSWYIWMLCLDCLKILADMPKKIATDIKCGVLLFYQPITL